MGPEGPMPGVAGGMMPPYDMGTPPMREMPGMLQPMPVGTLATALANANPEQQRTVWFLLFKNYLYMHMLISRISIFIVQMTSPNHSNQSPLLTNKNFKFQIYLVSSQWPKNEVISLNLGALFV